jgi:hypothetical protein
MFSGCEIDAVAVVVSGMNWSGHYAAFGWLEDMALWKQLQNQWICKDCYDDHHSQ